MAGCWWTGWPDGVECANWVLSKVSFGLIEFIRNTPLLIQVTFWYFAVVLNFPPAVIAAKYLDGVIISKQGVFIPSIALNEGGIFSGLSILLVAGIALYMTSRFARKGPARLAKLAVLIAAAGLLYYFKPLAMSFPTATRFSASGGTHFSAEMVALILGLSINACAYIAEILRGGLETLPKGQWEAASSLGFGRSKALTNIILPQVFRVVLPSLGNQYISLAKNTSIGIAIGYPDLFNVTGTVANQTGRTLEGIVLMVIAYLVISWAISGLTNVASFFVNKAHRGQR
ncbi:L-cystine transport system permease protein YecS [Pseudomonas syringae pv. actinidiae]|nr:L-cystine transport system permease protein YecS [Pseudomonas syringae pv. actinidiae]